MPIPGIIWAIGAGVTAYLAYQNKDKIKVFAKEVGEKYQEEINEANSYAEELVAEIMAMESEDGCHYLNKIIEEFSFNEKRAILNKLEPHILKSHKAQKYYDLVKMK